MPTKIEWCDEVWNVVTGCSKVSAGCEHCYAEAMSRRFDKDWKPWTKDNAAHNVKLHPERLEQPLHWRKPRRIFVASMGDLFHGEVLGSFITAAFLTMAETQRHTFLVLTKRAHRMRTWSEGMAKFWAITQRTDGQKGVDWPLPNVWLGVTAENQRTADERIPRLLETPAARRFVSCEPLLGPIDFTDAPLDPESTMSHWSLLDEIDWVIVGGESGPKARPMHPDWVRSIRDQCQAAGVSFHFKQWGEYICKDNASLDWEIIDYEGKFQPLFPNRDAVEPRACVKRVGKKAAGRQLDGRQWNEGLK